jgi:putative transcriptional regulator
LFRDIMAGLKETRAHLRGEVKLRERAVEFPEAMDVKAIRSKTGLSQAEFAARFHFSLRTLQEWEQGRAFPDAAVRAYLTVIARNHEAVERALAS